MNVALKNAKHEHFAQLMAAGSQAKAAYVLAGFSPNGAKQAAAKLLTRADLADRLAYLRQQKEAMHKQAMQGAVAEAGMDKAWVLKKLGKIVEIGMALEPVKGEDGQELGELKAANLPAANAALNLIGKELGMFIDRKEVRTGPLDDLPHDELKAMRDAIDTIGSSGASVAGSASRATH